MWSDNKRENNADMGEKARLLLVEDDEDLSIIMSMQLGRRGYQVLPAMNGAQALALLHSEQVDLVLLDVMLPDCEGHELCRMFRGDACGYQGPIIFMSCMGDGETIVNAFRKGGNDYMIKPVEIDALAERIEANLSEHRPQKCTGRQWYRQFVIDRKAHEVFRVSGHQLREKLDLSPTEFKLLLIFTEYPDEVLLYRQLYQKVWGQDDLGDYRPLMVHVSNLRKKIDGAHTEVIRAVRGVGYIFRDV